MSKHQRLPVFIIAAVWLLVAISGCGFQLRGNTQIAEQYNPLYVEQGELTESQWRLVRNSLKRASAQLTDQVDANRLRVTLRRLKDARLSGGSASDVELIEISMQLRFSVIGENGQVLLQPQELLNQKTLELDSNNVLVRDQFINSAVAEQERSLIRAMLYRLQK